MAFPPDANGEAPAGRADGASIVMLRSDAVLMVRRRRGPFAGLWSFPGGMGEAGEETAATARRELREETGLAVDSLAPLGLFQPAPDLPLVIAVFAARAGTGEPVAAEDAAEARFVPLERVLLLPRTPGAARWISRALQALAE
jgi:8-oxo-dGTP diphosphatase